MQTRPSIPDSRLDALLEAGDREWVDARAAIGGVYSNFVPSDHRGAYEELRELHERADTFLELGSAAGVVTIIADLLGYDAYGIELEPDLVERARALAARFDSNAAFAEGTFVPPEYRDEIEHLSGDFFTPTEGADGYEELGMELRDFDLIFAYPWPGEEDWLVEMACRHARDDAWLLTYHPDGGFRRMQAVRE